MPIDPQCFACKYSADPPYPLLETKHWKLYLSEDQAYLGRSYLNLKDHKSSLAELRPEEWQEFEELVRKIEPAYKSAFDAELLNWAVLMNNAFIEGSTPHVHWHIRPRHSKPVEVNGEVFNDELFGYHYDDNLQRKVSAETLSAIVSRISAQWNT
jgi:diadenosine tetraphosphate (Ap4A) HIT family hydrolase